MFYWRYEGGHSRLSLFGGGGALLGGAYVFWVVAKTTEVQPDEAHEPEGESNTQNAEKERLVGISFSEFLAPPLGICRMLYQGCTNADGTVHVVSPCAL